MPKERLFIAGRSVPTSLEPKKCFNRRPGCQKQNNVSIHFKLSVCVWIQLKNILPNSAQAGLLKGYLKKTRKTKMVSNSSSPPLFKQFTATKNSVCFPEETTEKRLFLVWLLIRIPPTEKDPRPSCWSHSRTRKRLSQPNGGSLEVLGIQVRLYLNMSISYLHVIYSGRNAIFHQPGFPEISGCFLTELPFSSDIVLIAQPLSTPLAGESECWQLPESYKRIWLIIYCNHVIGKTWLSG